MNRCIICQKIFKDKSTVCETCQKEYPPIFIYNQLYETGFRHKSTITPSFIRNILKILDKSDTVLEIGCGSGYLSYILNEKLRFVIAMDFVKINVELCKRRGLTIICADAENLPFKNRCFDFVISNELIEHLFHLDKHFKEVNRILKSGGHYLIKTPNKLLDDILRGVIMRSRDLQFWHPSTFYSFQIKRKISKFGFKIEISKLGQLPPSQLEKLQNTFFKKIIIFFNKYLPTIFQLSFMIDCTKI